MHASAELQLATASVRKVMVAISDGQQQLKEIVAKRDAAMAKQRDLGSVVKVKSRASIEPKTRVATSDRSTDRQPVPAEIDSLTTSVAEPTTGARLPAARVEDGVARRIKTGKGKSIVIVEGVVGELSANDVIVSKRQGAGGIVDCRIVAKKGTTAWDFQIAGKKVAELGQSNATLVLKIPEVPGPGQWLMEYLVLELLQPGEAKPLFISLGEPIEAFLDVRYVPLKSDEEKNYPTGSYHLFSDHVNTQITQILEEYPKLYLYESLEFKPGDLSSVPGSVGNSRPTFTLTGAADEIGFQLRRGSVDPLSYRWNGLAFPLKYGELNLKYKGVCVFDQKLLDEITRDHKADIENCNNLANCMQLEVAGKLDEVSYKQAKKFPIDDALRGRPVRLTLKKKGVDGGFIIVDSLDLKQIVATKPISED